MKILKALKHFKGWIKEQLPSFRKNLHSAVLIAQKVKNELEKQRTAKMAYILGQDKGVAVLARLRVIITQILHTLDLADRRYIGDAALNQALDILKPMNRVDRNRKYEELAAHILHEYSGVPIETAKMKVTEFYEENKDQIELLAGV